jgi:hypothetical protein
LLLRKIGDAKITLAEMPREVTISGGQHEMRRDRQTDRQRKEKKRGKDLR